MNTFEKLGISPTLLHNLNNIGFSQPTPIQEQAIPPALEGKDIIGSAQTGTGKTAAFGIPLASRIIDTESDCALVLTPTRELALQVMKQLQTFLGKDKQNQVALLIGGESMIPQLKQISRKPRLVVGTPGRINDHLKRGSLKLKNTSFLVLDEMDRMLDMGFSIQIEEILKHLPSKRQTLMFSATIPGTLKKMVQKYMADPLYIAVEANKLTAPKIKQDVLNVSEADKYDQLLKALDERSGSIVVFMKTKFSTEKTAIKLNKAGYQADAIHGDLRQNKRDRVIKAFRDQKYRILVATDVAARGLDIPHIEHVINYDLPQCPEDYIHRIGRTGRAGATGSALCLLSPADRGKWNAIQRLIDPNYKPEKAPHTLRSRKPGEGRKSGYGKPSEGRGSGNYGKSSEGRRSGGYGRPGEGRKSDENRKPGERNERGGFQQRSFKDSKDNNGKAKPWGPKKGKSFTGKPKFSKDGKPNQKPNGPSNPRPRRKAA